MDLAVAMASRRAIKGFDPEHAMPEETFRELFTLASLSPSAFNIQHWRIVRVRDMALRKAIREVAWDQTQVTDASVLLILTANLKAWENGARYWEGAPQPVVDFLVPAIDVYYGGKPQVERDECMRSLGILAQSLMLLAKHFDYDSCPMDGFDFDAVASLINLPKDHVIGCMVAIGKKTKEPWPRIGKLPLNEVLIEDRF